MAAPALTDIMEGVDARLATITGLRVTGKGHTPDQAVPPAAWCGLPERLQYHQAMQRGLMSITLKVVLVVAAASDREGQRALAGYADPTGAGSVIAALYGDKTLGGAASDLIVDEFRPVGLVSYGGVEVYAGEWSVRVHAVGS
jgi:hypothetical protein